MKVRLDCPHNDYLNDVQDIPRAFAPVLEVDDDADNFLSWKYGYADGKFVATIESDVFGSDTKELIISDENISDYKKYTKRFIKNFLYDFLSDCLSIKLPYGSLTGVRPTKLYYELMRKGDALGILMSEFRVTERRAKLIERCVVNQKGVINDDPDAVAIFVNIPFCPTRCSYCSFISTEVGRVKKELPRYVDVLLAEINAAKQAISSAGKKVTSIYVGGGTPGSIGVDNLAKILSPLSSYGVEFTVEAGRPDTIDAELVDVMKRNSVTRVSVNPQSFKEETLRLIGRSHTLDDVYRAYELTKDVFSVNMDLIAGLPGENTDDFKYSLFKTLELRPDNITVHSLSLKRGSVLTNDGNKKTGDGTVKNMTDFAMDVLAEQRYSPYYMYRQKNTADNLENVGYSLAGKQCKYNVDMMEESISVVGMGAGAMSKLVAGDRIERASDPKGFREYVERADEMINNKERFFAE